MTSQVATDGAADETAAQESTAVRTVGVVGGGIMGSGIAEVAARSGCEVILCEVSEPAAEGALARIRKSLGRAEKSGKLSAADREAAEGRLRTVTDLAELADRDLVIEAVIEDEAEKVAIFQALGKVVRPDALLASNTSSIPIMKLAAVTPQPQRVIGMHFFNPVPVLPLVELVPSLLTSQDTVVRADAYASQQLGKHTVLSKDRAGFIVNALLIPYLLAAIRMVESGFASPEDIDTGMVDGCAHPMGPLALTDLIGLDTTMAVAQSMYAEFKEPLYAPPPLLLRMVEAGLLGRKAGRGFFDYGTTPTR
jgi:3-hydroxybutyryl-CoA dehydrogenase